MQFDMLYWREWFFKSLRDTFELQLLIWTLWLLIYLPFVNVQTSPQSRFFGRMIHMTLAPPLIYDEETLICFLRLVPRAPA